MTPHELLAAWSSWWWPLLGDHLWQSTFLAAAALLAARLLGRAPARARHAVWLAVLAKFALPSALLSLTAEAVGLNSFALFSAPSREDPGPLVALLVDPVYRLTLPSASAARFPPDSRPITPRRTAF